MKQFNLLLLLGCLSQLACAFSVTFRVDMSNVTGFTTPEVNGTFNGWCGNCIPLSDIDGDNIWETTIDLTAGSYEYKFAADSWGSQETLVPGSACTVTTGGFTNRHLEVTGNIVLPIVCWSFCTSCEDAPQIYNVTFQVDMHGVNGFTTPEVNGGFNGWCGSCNQMSDPENDAIWEVTIPILEGTYFYMYSHDNWAGSETFLPDDACVTTLDGFTFREITFDSDTILPPLCWGSCDLCPPGCTDINACNYNSSAGYEDGSCTYPGCTDLTACNYNSDAACADNSCTYQGCNHPEACNYNSFAGCDDGSCLFPGCTDPAACNYSAEAGCIDGSCTYPGCINSESCNFNPLAGCDDGSCTQPGCNIQSACNYNPLAGCNNGSCLFPGCIDTTAMNFSATAGCDDGSCLYPGCTNPFACNYDSWANFDNGLCLMPGCTDNSACNYNPNAGCENGSCNYENAICNDNNSNTMLDAINSNCICAGTPYNYGSIATATINLCPGIAPSSITLTAPLNLQAYSLQWYYRDGANACPSNNSTAGWIELSGETGLTYTPSEFIGAKTFACFVSPSGIYGIPAAWANGCRTISYYSFDAQAIIGNPNISPFSTVTYAVNPINGHSYNWTVTNGAITSGQGSSVITILWGQNGPYQVTLNESNGICSDVSSLLVVSSTCNITVSAIAEGGNSFCPGASTMLQAITQATGITYQWYFNGAVIDNATNEALEIFSGGNYQVLITQGACTAVSQTLFISTLPSVVLPQLTVTYTSPGCSGGSVIIAAEGGTFDSYLWNTGENNAAIEVSTSGDYSVDLTDANGCNATAGPVSVNLALQEPLPICIVSVDATTNNNIIVWEPLASEVTSAYVVYKETNVTDEYVNIGTVNYGSDGLFTDPNSNASVQASRYKLALIDTCGIESFLTPHHKTIHLTSNVGLNNTINLIWSHYEGFFFGSYTIYRGSDANNFSVLTSIAGNLSSYTDIAPLAGQSYYFIEVEGISCDPSRESIFSRSNVLTITPDAITEPSKPTILIQPNPTSGEILITVESTEIGKNLLLTGLTGQVLEQRQLTSTALIMNLEQYAAGIYFLHINEYNHPTQRIKVIKQ